MRHSARRDRRAGNALAGAPFLVLVFLLATLVPLAVTPCASAAVRPGLSKVAITGDPAPGLGTPFSYFLAITQTED